MKPNTLSKSSFQRILDLSISQAVNEWIQKRGHNRVKNSHPFAEVQSTNTFWFYVNENATTISDGDHGDVRSAGGESFLPPSGGRDAQDREENVDVGNNVYGQGPKETECSDEKKSEFQEARVCTRKLHQWSTVTEKMIDGVWATIGHLKQHSCWDHSKQQPPNPGADHQKFADPSIHHGGVVKGFAYGHVPVNGHDCQKKELCGSKRKVQKGLCEATRKRDGFLASGHAGQCFRNDRGGESNFQEGKVSEEEIHWGVELVIQPSDYNNCSVPRYCQKVRAKYEGKKQDFNTSVVCKARKYEFSHHAVVPHFGHIPATKVNRNQPLGTKFSNPL